MRLRSIFISRSASVLISFVLMATMAQGQQRPQQQTQEQKELTLEEAQKTFISRAEYDTFQKIQAEQSPSNKAKMVEEFFAKWPNSQLAIYIHFEAIKAYQQLNVPDKIIHHGEAYLKLQPNALDIMTMLASLYAAQKQPDKAKAKAQAAIDAISKMEKPAQVSEQQWQAYKAQQLATNHATIGFIHLQAAYAAQDGAAKTKEFEQAAEHLSKALQFNRNDDLSWYRLGLAYAGLNKPKESLEALAKAVAVNGPTSAEARKTLEGLYRRINPIDRKVEQQVAIAVEEKVNAEMKNRLDEIAKLATELLEQKKAANEDEAGKVAAQEVRNRVKAQVATEDLKNQLAKQIREKFEQEQAREIEELIKKAGQELKAAKP